eukprot:1160006-Pelagomonas_calceolata.AAC.7
MAERGNVSLRQGDLGNAAGHDPGQGRFTGTFWTQHGKTVHMELLMSVEDVCAMSTASSSTREGK